MASWRREPRFWFLEVCGRHKSSDAHLAECNTRQQDGLRYTHALVARLTLKKHGEARICCKVNAHTVRIEILGRILRHEAVLDVLLDGIIPVEEPHLIRVTIVLCLDHISLSFVPAILDLVVIAHHPFHDEVGSPGETLEGIANDCRFFGVAHDLLCRPRRHLCPSHLVGVEPSAHLPVVEGDLVRVARPVVGRDPATLLAVHLNVFTHPDAACGRRCFSMHLFRWR